MNRLFSLFILVTALFIATSQVARAQFGSDFMIVNQLMKQQRYEQAYPMLKDLLEQNPHSTSIYESIMECLINLKRYEEAINITQERLDNNITPLLSQTQLGKLYHIKGDTSRAYEVWNHIIERQPNNLQAYITISRIMRERREYKRSVNVLHQARKQASNPNLFRREIISTYLLAGSFDKATREMIELIKEDPKYSSYIQRLFMRFEDEFLYDTAILEIEETIKKMDNRDNGLNELYDLQLWLLLERNLYRRAFMTAKRYEMQNQNAAYTLYNMGHKFKSQRKYKLAESAFQFYAERPESPLQINSMQKLAELYIDWADYLKDRSLGTVSRTDSLYKAADDLLQHILDKYPDYNNLSYVITTKAEIAIEHLHDIDSAVNLLDRLKDDFAHTENPQINYLEGRIKLYNNNYSMARVFLTRAKKQARAGSLAEKANYFLSLTDFYAGDFEFAKIQLRALERQHTSNFANDALQLRMWIQDGLKLDSTGTHLIRFAKAVKQLEQDQLEAAYKGLAPLITGNEYPPLKDDAALLVAKHAKNNPGYFASGYMALQIVLDTFSTTPLKERLLWEQARLAELLVEHPASLNNPVPPAGNSYFRREASALDNELHLPDSPKDLINLYEQLILEFPNGFYASTARERLRELENQPTS